MKEEKKSPPAAERHLLEVHVDVSTNEARVRPTSKLRNLSDKYINAGAISNAEAGSLAGEASFFDSSCMGHVGRAAMLLLFARQQAAHACRIPTTHSQQLCRLSGTCHTLHDLVSLHCQVNLAASRSCTQTRILSSETRGTASRAS